jgi:hypothetical protein
MAEAKPVTWRAVSIAGAAVLLMAAGAIAIVPRDTAPIAPIRPAPSPAPSPTVPAALAICDAQDTFHLERLRANKSLKVVALGEKGTANVQRFLDLTMQSPLDLSTIPRVKVWVAWQYNTASFYGTAPAIGVIDIVQDNCVLYRRTGTAAEIVAIANGDWSL